MQRKIRRTPGACRIKVPGVLRTRRAKWKGEIREKQMRIPITYAKYFFPGRLALTLTKNALSSASCSGPSSHSSGTAALLGISAGSGPVRRFGLSRLPYCVQGPTGRSEVGPGAAGRSST